MFAVCNRTRGLDPWLKNRRQAFCRCGWSLRRLRLRRTEQPLLGKCIWMVFFKKNGPTPASFLFIFGLYKQTIQYLQQSNVKKCPNVHWHLKIVKMLCPFKKQNICHVIKWARLTSWPIDFQKMHALYFPSVCLYLIKSPNLVTLYTISKVWPVGYLDYYFIFGHLQQ